MLLHLYLSMIKHLSILHPIRVKQDSIQSLSLFFDPVWPIFSSCPRLNGLVVGDTYCQLLSLFPFSYTLKNCIKTTLLLLLLPFFTCHLAIFHYLSLSLNSAAQQRTSHEIFQSHPFFSLEKVFPDPIYN